MSAPFKVGQDAWVRRAGTTQWYRVEVIALPGKDRFMPDDYIVQLPSGEQWNAAPGRIVHTLNEVKAYGVYDDVEAPDFTEHDEPLGEVPDLPPMYTNHRCDTEPVIGVRDGSSVGYGGFPLPPHPPVPMPHLTVHQTMPRLIVTYDGGIEQLAEYFTNRHPNALAGSWGMEPRPLSRTEPVMDTTGKNIPADPRILPHERPHNSIPADRRREAVRDAYGIITQFAVEFVDVTDVLRIAEYINNGIDYADTTVSIQAEALRTETDAAADVAVSKIHGDRVPDGKRWD